MSHHHIVHSQSTFTAQSTMDVKVYEEERTGVITNLLSGALEVLKDNQYDTPDQLWHEYLQNAKSYVSEASRLIDDAITVAAGSKRPMKVKVVEDTGATCFSYLTEDGWSEWGDPVNTEKTILDELEEIRVERLKLR